MQIHNQNNIENSRITGIDSLRGIAALVMALFHANGPFGLQLNVPNFRLDIFFILSGFIISLVYENKIYNHNIIYTDFLIKRISRLVPLHYITLILTLLLFTVYFLSDRQDLIPSENNIFTFFLHLLLLQNIGLTEHLTWNYVSWSISSQIIVESLWFLLLYNKKNSTYLYLIIIIITSFFLIKSFGLTFAEEATKFSIIFINAGMLRFLMDFSIGILIFRFFYIKFKMLKNTQKYLLNIFSFIIFSYLIIIWLYKPFHFNGSDYANAIFIYPALISLSLNSKTFLSTFLKIPIFKYLGKISYSIFLIHPLLIIIMCKFQKHYNLNIYFLLFMYYIILIFISSISYKYIELPGASIVNRFFNKNKLQKLYKI